MERDLEAEKFALVGSLGVVPAAFGVLGSWLWPLFNAAGDSIHQDYRLSEILTGLIGGVVLGLVIGATLLYVRSKTETPDPEVH
jgi:H+/Cl- antiporter ClcA